MVRIKLLPFILLFTPLFISCTELSEYDSSQVRSSLNDSLIVTTESWDVEMILMQDGKNRLLIEGSYAINYQASGRKQTEIEGPVYVQIYDTLGAVETEAWSKRAIYLEERAEFELFDSVRVETITGNRLYSEYLKWTQDSDRITSPYFVTIITATDSISGSGFDGTTDLEDYVIERPSGRMMVD
ncbi:MAG: LPS export ABC transporter periplasmic protein LptC [Balneolaceae bacterium]|nr:LPS export ABC transporter periplasmic protein LptC [Balneolaceae bacterium]